MNGSSTTAGYFAPVGWQRPHPPVLRARHQPDLAQVDVQNRLPCHAAPAFQRGAAGVRVDEPTISCYSSSSPSDNGSRGVSELGLRGDQTCCPLIQRVPGVGQANLFGCRARCASGWTGGLVGYRLSPAGVNGHPGTERPGGLRDPGDRLPVDAQRLRHRWWRGRTQHGRAVRRHRAARQHDGRPCACATWPASESWAPRAEPAAPRASMASPRSASASCRPRRQCAGYGQLLKQRD